MHIVFAGGGTAGHINPALAVAGYIKEKHPDAKISYIGVADKLEARLVPEKGYDFYSIDVAGFQRSLKPKSIIKNISAVKKAIVSSNDCVKLLKKLQPDLVVGTGGYVSGPVLKAAQKLGIKNAIHEQNAFPGVTTKMLIAKADAVMLAYADAKKHLKLNKEPIITGNPVRRELLSLDKAEAKRMLGMEDKPLILSFGGSLGARRINEAMTDIIKWHNDTDKFYHIHGAGKAGYETMLSNLSDIQLSSNIQVREYISDMDVCMAAADLVICRAGAITLSEIQACSKAAVLIPSPNVAENHQYFNALSLEKAGCAKLIEEKDLTKDLIIKTVENLIENKPKLQKMENAAKNSAIIDANERIYEVLMQLYTKA